MSYEYDGSGRRLRITEGVAPPADVQPAGQLVYETTMIPG
ncbi:Hypothetical protein I596_999 [Dokdonella koreensis DS-123]|uniref:Uncharacterized protein n=1 Tax=Dokdonella koreensis DS-123 TaxID=1300342 RepID=A0A160DS00_9GAMM|nr:Hypothetical protein I596_999 [Dokdonella koreensis DS-123]